jgi:hypothetical protein
MAGQRESGAQPSEPAPAAHKAVSATEPIVAAHRRQAAGDLPGDTGHVEEVAHGAERAPWAVPVLLRSRWHRVPRVLRVAVAAAVLAVVAVPMWHALQPAARRQVLPPAPSLAPRSALLAAQDVCTTLVGPTLEVTFLLTNTGRQPLQLLDVRPELPLGMLLTLGRSLDSGHCGTAKAPTTGQPALAAGASVPVTFRLLPMVNCAQPAPVQAAVSVAATGGAATVTIPVLPDLGSVDFPGCAAAVGSP